MNPANLSAMMAVTATLAVLLAGYRSLQLGLVVLALLAGLAGLAGNPGAGPHAPAVFVSLLAAVGLLGFSGWNLVGMPGERWAFRVVIYGFYAAGCAAGGSVLASAAVPAEPLAHREWIICGVIYAGCSVVIVATKPWFARRMRDANARRNPEREA